MRRLSPQLNELCQEVGKKFHVPPDIHESDFIFWNLVDGLGDDREAVELYFQSGKSTAEFIRNIVKSLPLQRPYKLLDFASGYGRVARHLKVLLPAAEIVTADVHPDAVSFNKAIGLESVESPSVPELFNPGSLFEVIVAISFFTHMPNHTWGRWLRSIGDFLTPRGTLVFTTHGRAALSHMGITNVDRSGFRFDRHSEQGDLDASEYGSTVTFFEYVCREATNSNLRVLRYQEAGAGYQDLFLLTPM